MATTTPKGLFPYPQAADPNNVPADMQALATRLDEIPGVESFTNAQRDALAAGQKWDGRVIWNSSLMTAQVWNGAAWVPVAETVPTQGTFAARPAANGRQGIYRVTDAVTVPVGTTYADVAGTWREIAMSEALSATYRPVPTVAALTPTTGAATVDLGGADYLTHALTGNPDYSATSNRVQGRSVAIRVNPGASARTPTFNASWRFIGAKPTTFNGSKYGLLTVACVGGTAESDIIAAYAEEA